MKTIFVANDLQKESEHLCFVSKNISMGYYHSAGFWTLPYLASCQSRSVYFPNLQLSKSFWQNIQKCNQANYGDKFPSVCVNEIQRKLIPFYKRVSQLKIERTIKYWSAKEITFYKFVREFLCIEDLFKKITKVEILLTRYGTCGSFYPVKESGKYKIIITHRVDFPDEYIAKTLLLCIIKLKCNLNAEPGEYRWYKRREIAKFLSKNTVFSKIFSNTNTHNKSKNYNLLKDSQQYLTDMGFPAEKLLDLDNNKSITISGKKTNKLFTNQEQIFIRTLMHKYPDVATYDEIATALWKEKTDIKFSLYAISKLAESTRKKIKNYGIRKNIIMTFRNLGYCLNN